MRRRPPCSRRPLLAQLRELQGYVRDGNMRGYAAARLRLPTQARGVLAMLGFWAKLGE